MHTFRSEHGDFLSSLDKDISEFYVASVAHGLTNHRLDEFAPRNECVPSVRTEFTIAALAIFGANGASRTN